MLSLGPALRIADLATATLGSSVSSPGRRCGSHLRLSPGRLEFGTFLLKVRLELNKGIRKARKWSEALAARVAMRLEF